MSKKQQQQQQQFLVALPWCNRTIVVNWAEPQSPSYQDLLHRILNRLGIYSGEPQNGCYLVHQAKILDPSRPLLFPFSSQHHLQLQLRLLGGMDRQNRVGSKFGGGGVSSSQNAERERKDRLKKLALESIDLAKDPYLVRNHLGSYECKLCLTLHRDEANYLAHTQGKKHQQGLARRAHLETLKQQNEGTQAMPLVSTQKTQPIRTKLRIGRPAYQVFKSRDSETNQRCLSFELHYPELEEWQPRHRFMSAFEQRVDSPPDRRYQYLLCAAGDYETVAFRIPNEPIDKGQDRFVTHWDADTKKFTLTLHFLEPQTDTDGKK
jgi:splicing factor 3A subunit 2